MINSPCFPPQNQNCAWHPWMKWVNLAVWTPPGGAVNLEHSPFPPVPQEPSSSAATSAVIPATRSPPDGMLKPGMLQNYNPALEETVPPSSCCSSALLLELLFLPTLLQLRSGALQLLPADGAEGVVCCTALLQAMHVWGGGRLRVRAQPFPPSLPWWKRDEYFHASVGLKAIIRVN